MTQRIAVIGTRPPKSVNGRPFPAQTRIYELIRADVVAFFESLVLVKTRLPGGDIVIVSGGAPGVDSLAVSLGRRLGFEVVEHRPEPEKYGGNFGRAAYARNQLICDDSTEGYAWPSPWGTGTQHTVSRFVAAGKPCAVREPWKR